MTQAQQPDNALIDAARGREPKPPALRYADALDCMEHEGMHKAAAELRRLYYREQELGVKLVAEASRTANEKLRADQMSQQHDMQAAMNREARQQLAAQAQCAPLTADQLAGQCEQWLQAGGATNIVDAFEVGFRCAEVTRHITGPTP